MFKLTLLLCFLICSTFSSEKVLIDYYDLNAMDLEDLEAEYEKSLIEDEECYFDPLDHMITWNTLMIHNDLINRTIEILDNGIASITESEDPRLAFKLKKHVHQMFARMQCQQATRSWDPLFKAVFDSAPLIDVEISDTPKGISYLRTSEDDYVQKVILAHAAVISEFVEKGRSQTRLGHEAPDV